MKTISEITLSREPDCRLTAGLRLQFRSQHCSADGRNRSRHFATQSRQRRPPAAPAFTMTVNGSNFGANAVVNWNGAAQPRHHLRQRQPADRGHSGVA